MNDSFQMPGRQAALSADEVLACSSDISEGQALSLLRRRDLSQRALEALAGNREAMRHRSVLVEVVSHPRAPRHVSLPAMRHLYTFELMQVALTPAVPADVKLAAEDTLISRLDTISTGERLTLARRSSARLAVVLLLDLEERVIDAALENLHLTEEAVVKSLMKPNAPNQLAARMLRHQKWAVRTDVQLALLECGKLRAAETVVLVRSLPTKVLDDAWHRDRLPALAKAALTEELRVRRNQRD